jgi:hypothetical protein
VVIDPWAAVFVVVQGLYGWFLMDQLVSNQEGKIWKWGRAMGSLVILLVAWWISPEEIRLLLMVGGLYGVQLLFNVALALRLWKQVPWMAFGMVMFLGCDGLVALSSIQAYFTHFACFAASYSVYFASSFSWIWFFYYPSQFILVMTVVQTFEEENRSSFVGFLAFLVKLEMHKWCQTITIKIMKIKR